MGEYSPAKTGECLRIFFNFQNCARCVKDLKDNKDNSLHLGLKYARIFVLGHYLFVVAHNVGNYLWFSDRDRSTNITTLAGTTFSKELRRQNGMSVLLIFSYFIEE